MVIECGAGVTSIVPVFEGLLLTHALINTDYGGIDITNNLKKILAENNYNNIDYVDARVIKEKMCSVYVPSKEFVYNINNNSESNIKQFELPDGTLVKVNKKVFTDCTENLFRNTNNNTNSNSNNNNNGIISQAYEALRLCDDSIRKDLANNIVVAGGTSLLPGLSDRLAVELQQRINSDAKTSKNSQNIDIRVIPNSKYSESGYTFQRRTAAWIGGSIVASIQDTYKEIKITKQEWDEEKENCILTKCI